MLIYQLASLVIGELKLANKLFVLKNDGAENNYLPFAPFYCYVNVSAKQAADEGNPADIKYNMYKSTSGTFTLPGLMPYYTMKFNIIDSASTQPRIDTRIIILKYNICSIHVYYHTVESIFSIIFISNYYFLNLFSYLKRLFNLKIFNTYCLFNYFLNITKNREIIKKIIDILNFFLVILLKICSTLR